MDEPSQARIDAAATELEKWFGYPTSKATVKAMLVKAGVAELEAARDAAIDKTLEMSARVVDRQERVHELEAEVARLRTALADISAFSYHNDDCEARVEYDDCACSCGYTTALEATRAMLAGPRADPNALISWIDGACVDERPHMEIRAAIDRWRAGETTP